MKKTYETPKVENVSFVTEAITKTGVTLPPDDLGSLMSHSTNDRI